MFNNHGGYYDMDGDGFVLVGNAWDDVEKLTSEQKHKLLGFTDK